MITIRMKDGTECSVSGDEEKAVLDRIVGMKEEVAKLRGELALLRRDVTFLVRQYDGEIDATGEACILKGTRREQFEWVCAYLKAHPESSIFAPCVIAVGEIRGPGGYTSARSLQRYCCAHKHAFGG